MPSPSMALLACCKVSPYPCERELKLSSRSNSVKGIPLCRQATANVTPPIPAPIMAMCGKFSVSTIVFFSEGNNPEPEQFKQVSSCPLGRTGGFTPPVDFSNFSRAI